MKIIGTESSAFIHSTLWYEWVKKHLDEFSIYCNVFTQTHCRENVYPGCGIPLNRPRFKSLKVYFLIILRHNPHGFCGSWCRFSRVPLEFMELCLNELIVALFVERHCMRMVGGCECICWIYKYTVHLNTDYPTGLPKTRPAAHVIR